MSFVGVRPPGWLGEEGADFAALLEWTRRAEALGFDAIFVGDRLLAQAGGDQVVYGATMLEPFTVLAAMAAATRRVRLLPLVANIPFRHPAVMAKMTATLDVISDGRFILGAGAGWSPPELELFGVDKKTSGLMMAEGIELIRQLWTGRPVSADGFWRFRDVRVLPRPVQQPGPPIWLASGAPNDRHLWAGDFQERHRRVLTRAGRLADAWVPLTYSAGYKGMIPSQILARSWEIIEEGAEAAGRPGAVELIYPHWIAVVNTPAQRRQCEAALATYFQGDWEQARATYPIGSPEEIVETIRDHTAGLPRVDSFLFTPIIANDEQLELISTEVRRLLG